MDDKTFYTLLVSVLLAIVGLIGKYVNDLRVAERKDRLERVNSQLKDLYGPLRAFVHAADAAWIQFRSGCRPTGSFFESSPPPSEQELHSWRLWMCEVFVPLHERMEQTILSNLHLLVGGEVPACISTLLAHIAAYRPVLKKWASGDFQEHSSSLNYPGQALRLYVDAAYEELAHEQQRLLGTRKGEALAANRALQRTPLARRR